MLLSVLQHPTDPKTSRRANSICEKYSVNKQPLVSQVNFTEPSTSSNLNIFMYFCSVSLSISSLTSYKKIMHTLCGTYMNGLICQCTLLLFMPCRLYLASALQPSCSRIVFHDALFSQDFFKFPFLRDGQFSHVTCLTL